MECTICFENIYENKMYIYTCSHYFHSKCIKNWKGSCPICRSPKKLKNLLTLYPTVISLNIEPYLKYDDIRNCYNNLHYLFAYQMRTPPFGCCILCKECNYTMYYSIC